MKEQFINDSIALKLKEIGFNEECIGYYDCSFGPFGWEKGEVHFNKNFFINNHSGIDRSNENWIQLAAPLYQQVEEWFRVKHNLHISIYRLNYNWVYQIFDFERNCYITSVTMEFLRIHRTYPEAREQGILKAIEIIKNN